LMVRLRLPGRMASRIFLCRLFDNRLGGFLGGLAASEACRAGAALAAHAYPQYLYSQGGRLAHRFLFRIFLIA
jgi:hypothetical protein